MIDLLDHVSNSPLRSHRPFLSLASGFPFVPPFYHVRDFCPHGLNSPAANAGCVSFFCTKLFCSNKGGRRTSEKGFVPGVTRARTGRWVILDGLSRRSGSSRGMRQPIQPY